VRISDFDYPLPPEAIAQHPPAERDAGRLLVLARAGTDPPRHHAFRELPDLLAPGDLLVLNRSRVLPARLLGRRAGGGAAEVLLLHPDAAASADSGEQRWRALLRPARRLRPGDTVAVADGFTVRIDEGRAGPDGARAVVLSVRLGTVEQAIDRHGHVPLPPYIQRPDAAEDRVRYQTVYAREPGSVAAPTAGLHFTPAVFGALAARGVAWTEIVLHVGPGTFLPVRVEQVEEHRLAPEPVLVPEAAAQAIAAARERGGRVVAVGTTVVRALESTATGGGRVGAGEGATDLVIRPGHRFQVVDALLTNFHLPRSSLLLLVSAFAGRERVLAAYAEALASGYRFYSYGDAMLVV
jgi:S-adenosylmethionine:tRNA ribosyltransferase-isomerase